MRSIEPFSGMMSEQWQNIKYLEINQRIFMMNSIFLSN